LAESYENDRQSFAKAAQTRLGVTVSVKVLRNGKELTVTVKLGERPTKDLCKNNYRWVRLVVCKQIHSIVALQLPRG
jgi:hypothetical protein